MFLRTLLISALLIKLAYGQQPYKVCVPRYLESNCQVLHRDDSKVQCLNIVTRIDCALELARGTADFGVFSEEEMVLLSQQQPTNHRVIASIKHNSRAVEDFAFEAVAVVSSSYTGGLDGLRNSGICHPGLDQQDQRWSPRVLRTLEQKLARTDRCAESDTVGKSFEEVEVAALSSFFRAACRPGTWSVNVTLDAELKSKYPNLCALCNATANSVDCNSGYTYEMGVRVAGVNNENRHIQALECLTKYQGNVSFVAWQHVREYFQFRSFDQVDKYALLCEDGTTRNLNAQIVASPTTPCSWVRQPWSAIVATTDRAAALQAELRDWWPGGARPVNFNWQAVLFDVLVKEDVLRAHFRDDLPTALDYVASGRNLTDIDATTTCMPTRRWCTINEKEHSKCLWVRRAAYVLGLEPTISCQQRENEFQCLEDIRDSRADFISLDSNYGYIARVRYSLSSVKLLQNSRVDSSRVAVLVKESSATSQEITRFENLRDKRACFPEFGGLAYVAFIRAAHERSIISNNECDYAKAVGEFFSGSCAPGATDVAHSITEDSNFNTSVLCSVCQNTYPISGPWPDFTCAADYSNAFYSTNGTIACLADPSNHVAFIETQYLERHINNLGLNPNSFRALCRNNTLAQSTGVQLDDNCLIALVINEEVLTRRNDNHINALNSLLNQLDTYFGYNAAIGNQLINLEIFSPFDSDSNLLFLDTAIGLTEPSMNSTHEPARNYFELFSHLESCNSATDVASKTMFSLISIIVMAIITKCIS